MGSPQRRQLQFDADALLVRAFPLPQDSTDNDSGYPGTATDDTTTIATSIGLNSATTKTLNGNGDTLSLVVVSTQYGADPVTSYSATSSSSPTITTARTTTRSMAPASTTTSTAASAGETTKSPTPLPVQQHHHDNDLSDGSLAAAIVVPIVAVLAITAILFFCFRRRKRQAHGERAGSLGAVFIPASIKEKWSSMRTSNASGRQQEPVVTNIRNNAYNTGLDTSSHGSGYRSQQTSGEFTPGRRSEGGTTFVQPPPPYDVNARNSQQMPTAPTLPQMAYSTPLSMSFDMPRGQQARSVSPHSRPSAARAPPSSHSLSPLSHIHDTPSAAALLAMPLDLPQPSSRSARSITSTLYSDTASVHSARAARMSVGGPNVVQSQPGASRSMSGSARSGIDPFDTEANTPITPLSTQDQQPVTPVEHE